LGGVEDAIEGDVEDALPLSEGDIEKTCGALRPSGVDQDGDWSQSGVDVVECVVDLCAVRDVDRVGQRGFRGCDIQRGDAVAAGGQASDDRGSDAGGSAGDDGRAGTGDRRH